MGVDLTLCSVPLEIFRRQAGLDNLCVFLKQYIIYLPIGGVDLTLCSVPLEFSRRQPGLDNLCDFLLQYYHLAPHRGVDDRI